MPRNALGGHIYHVLNRATNRRQIFSTTKDYQEFLTLLVLAQKRFSVEVYAFAVMPNHIHLILSPKGDDDMSRFMHWLFTTHANSYRTNTETIGDGHVYQSRYKSFVVQDDEYYYTVLKYVEQNALRAGLVARAEDWPWGSAWVRLRSTQEEKKGLLAPSYLLLPGNYESWVNDGQDGTTLNVIRKSVNNGIPYGSDKWTKEAFEIFGIEPLRPRGRPKKQK
jgi:putative transposase